VKSSLRSSLDAERKSLEAQLAEPSTRHAPHERRDLEQRLNCIYELLSRLTDDRRRKQKLQALIAIASGAILALGLWFRLPTATVQVDADANGLTFTTTPGSSEAREFASPDPFDSTKLIIQSSANVEERAATHVISLVVEPETTIEMRGDGDGCFTLFIEPRSVTDDKPYGLSVTISDIVSPHPDGSVPTLPMPSKRSLSDGGTLQLCLADRKFPLLMARVTALQFWRPTSITPPRLTVSTLIAGKLRIAESGETMDLGMGDRLSLQDIRHGWLIVMAQRTVGIVFSGVVHKAELAGASGESVNREIIPSIAKYLSSSPKLTWLWGALVAIAGAIWGMQRFLLQSS
jgi:hypothetical protein